MNRLLLTLVSLISFCSIHGQSTFLKSLFDTKTPQARHWLNDLFELENGNFIASKTTSGSGYTSTNLILYSDSIKKIRTYPLAYHYLENHHNTIARHTLEILPNKIISCGFTHKDSIPNKSVGYSEIYDDTLGLLWGEYDTTYALDAAPLSDSTFVTLHIDSINKRVSLRKYDHKIKLVWEVFIDTLQQKASANSQDLFVRNVYTGNNLIYVRYDEDYGKSLNHHDELIVQCDGHGKYLKHYEYRSSTLIPSEVSWKTRGFKTTKNYKLWIYRHHDGSSGKFSYSKVEVFNHYDSLLFEVYSDSSFYESFKNAVELKNKNLVISVRSSDKRHAACNGNGNKLIFYSPLGNHLQSNFYPSNEISRFNMNIEESQGNFIILSGWASVSSTGHGLAYLLKLDSLGGAHKDYPIPWDTLYLNPPITQLTDSCWRNTTSTEEPANYNEIMVFPNPAKQNVFVQARQEEKLKIKLFDGKGALKQTLRLGNNDISKLPQGLYFVVAKSQSGTITSKLIIHE